MSEQLVHQKGCIQKGFFVRKVKKFDFIQLIYFLIFVNPFFGSVVQKDLRERMYNIQRRYIRTYRTYHIDIYFIFLNKKIQLYFFFFYELTYVFDLTHL